MENNKYLNLLRLPKADSHKGQNGRLLIIGGSHLFHAASLWSLKVASRIDDLVHYSSVLENNEIVSKLKSEFRNGIIIARKDIEYYVKEDDCILIGPGMVRSEAAEEYRIKNTEFRIKKLEDILKLEDEGVQTYFLTKFLLRSYPQKKWVIDAGALQMLELSDIPRGAILTPHTGEFERLKSKIKNIKLKEKIEKADFGEQTRIFAKEFNCIVVLKGVVDFVASEDDYIEVKGGNAGMTKGGTGDVLAGLIAALYTTNEAFISACCGSIINKKAGEDLQEISGLWFNASDLADQIPKTMKKLLL